MPRTKSPLRYPGGKTQLSKFIKYTLEINNLKDPIYCEPFSGGFGAGLELLSNNTVKQAIINDIDSGIYSVWYAILYDINKLTDFIESVDITIDEWNNQKYIYENLIQSTNGYSFELASATFFLNRTNVSGIITGGPIGGQTQNSKYKIDCRFNKENIIKKIQMINSFKPRIKLYNLDAIELINNVLLKSSNKDLFVFFDPPYYKQGKNLYTNFYSHEDHEILKNHISLMDDFYWITTYDVSEEILNLYNNYSPRIYKIRYSANKVRKAEEYMFCSPITKIQDFDKVFFI